MSGRDASHRESVMHFELDRQLAAGGARRPRAPGGGDPARRSPRGARLRADAGTRAPHDRAGSSGAVRYQPQEVGEAIDFLGWLAQLNFVLLGYREYELVDVDGQERAGIVAVAGSGLGILSDVQRSAFAEVTPLAALDDVVRARIEGGDLLVFSKTNSYSTRAPASAHGLHRRAHREPGGRDHRRGPADRPVHVEGVHGAGGEDAVAAPQARADPRRRRPDPRVARLQGSRRALRVVPEGRAVPGLGRRAPAARGRAAAAREARRHQGADAPRPLRAERLGRRGPAARPVQRRAAQAPAAVLPRAVPRHDGRLPPVARRDRVGAHLLHRARRARDADPRGAVRGARGRGGAARPQLGRRPARRPRRCGSGRSGARCSPRSTRRGSRATTRQPTNGG